MAMAPRSLALLCALLLAAFSTSFAASDAPFLVAHKKVALTRPKPGLERLAVSLDIYNQGSATAYDVTINDDSWPKEAFELVSGEVSKTLERLDPGSTASHVFVLETKAQGRFLGSPAVIKYRVPTKSVLQEAYSTPILPLDILAERPPVQKFEWAKNLVAKYGALVSVVSFVLGFIYLVATPSKSSGAKSGKKRR
jgi:translocon-associated protein subunit beta